MELHNPAPSGWEQSIVASAVIAGMVIGTCVFGGLGDILGRQRALALTLLICTVGAVGSAVLVFPSNSFSIYLQLALWRQLLGESAQHTILAI